MATNIKHEWTDPQIEIPNTRRKVAAWCETDEGLVWLRGYFNNNYDDIDNCGWNFYGPEVVYVIKRWKDIDKPDGIEECIE